MSRCGACSLGFSSYEGFIASCSTCNALYHSEKDCSGLTASEMRVIELKTKPFMVYKCRDCHDKGRVCCADEMRSLHGKLDSLEATCNDLKLLREDVDSLKVEVDDLHTQVEICKNKVTVFKTADNALISSTKNQITREAVLKIIKANNIIIFHLPEASTPGADVTTVRDMFSHLPLDLSRIVCRKLGKPSPGTVRPLLVTLASPNDPHLVLKNRASLKDNYKNCKISLDKTEEERMQLRRAVAELKRRRGGGEKDLIIKILCRWYAFSGNCSFFCI